MNPTHFKGFFVLLVATSFFAIAKPCWAIVNPQDFPNNPYGIHIISATAQEASEAAQLVNSSGGDWGYVTFLIESKDRNVDKWQAFFNDLRRQHLIPIVRLATLPDGSNWKLPYEGEEQAWADFLDNLIWPTKNRYVVIYNEPNQGQEWAGKVDASSYTQVLDKTITALKNKNQDFFVMNAGFDASSPNRLPNFQDEASFLKQMDQEVPGIFEKLDGWVSHSYPNPGFVGSPEGSGKGSVKTWEWELTLLTQLGVKKTLPVFITETGWKHAEGEAYDRFLPSAQDVAQYYKQAFTNVWNDPRIVAVTPFLLDYQNEPFDHFSFKKQKDQISSLNNTKEIFPNYYQIFEEISKLAKNQGKPKQIYQGTVSKDGIYSSIVAGETYTIMLALKNTGQAIWGDSENVHLVFLSGETQLGIENLGQTENSAAEPGREAIFKIKLKAPMSGNIKVSILPYHNSLPFDQAPFEFQTEVKSPVIIKVNSSLTFKKDFSGNYYLTTNSINGRGVILLPLDKSGQSQPTEARYLLPDYEVGFTLERPYYQPQKLILRVKSGINELNFKPLMPDFLSALLKPKQLWKLLPFSN